MPGRRERDSPTFWSGYWPIESADTPSWIASLERLASTALSWDSYCACTTIVSRLTGDGPGVDGTPSWAKAPEADDASTRAMAVWSGWRRDMDDWTGTVGTVRTVCPPGFTPMTAGHRRLPGVPGIGHTATAPVHAAAMTAIEVRHPLVQHKLGLLRDASLSTKAFRELVTELGTLLAYEATADLDTEPATTTGWAGEVQVRRIGGAKLTLVPILRAGLGMLPGVLALIPAAKVSVVGLQRDEQTLQPVPYFERLTGRLDERDALILDPMLATGGTLVATIDMLKRAGARRIKGIFLVAAPEGLRRLEAAHPDVEVYTAAIDARLDEHGYILPGLGDAGDRIFGTRVG